MSLYQHQEEFLKKKIDKGLLVWSCGTGKTMTSITWAFEKTRSIINNKGHVLIICPKALQENWAREIAKSGLRLNHLIISKEQFSKNWQTLEKAYAIIIDEMHFFSGIKSGMSKNLSKFIKKYNVPYILGLTATPYLSTPLNVYVLGKHVGKVGYEWSYPYFMQEYFFQVNMGGRMIPMVRKNIEEDIAERIREIADVVDIKDCIDIPDDVNVVEHFKLTSSQLSAIKKIPDIVPIVRWTKTHQIAGGTCKGDEYNPDQYFKSDKLDRLLDIVSENKKLLIVCRYNNEIDYIHGELINKKKVFIINGSVKDKQSVVDEANNTDDCVLLVNASCAEGYECPTFPIMVFYSIDFSMPKLVQIRGRIQRMNAIQKCTYIYLVCEGIDTDVHECVVVKKQDFHLSIYKPKIL